MASDIVSSELILVPIHSDPVELPRSLASLDSGLQEKLSSLIKKGLITHKKDTQLILSPLSTPHILFYGLGQKPDLDSLRRACGHAAREAKRLHCSSLTISLPDSLISQSNTADNAVAMWGQAASEGVVMGSYTYTAFQPKKHPDNNDDHALHTLSFFCDSPNKDIMEGAKTGLIVGEAVNMARDLANCPANYLTPKLYVEKAKSVFKDTAVRVDVIDEEQAKALGMNAFLGVGKGSVNRPYMIVLKYEPESAKAATKKPLVFVGKGITFDTGGISIKPSKSMSDMKGDMSGSAAVFASLWALSKLGTNDHVIGIIPAAENMPSAMAQKPGDVVTAMNGKTIEILNTDAEGRLVLADALCYAVTHLNARQIVDIATLTGACSVALGDCAAALLSNSDDLAEAFLRIQAHTGDRLWRLPLYDDYLDLLKSSVADLANCYEGRLAGTSSAAKFLEQFVDGTPWAHLDIASVMDSKKTTGYLVKGMNGSGVRNLIGFGLGMGS